MVESLFIFGNGLGRSISNEYFDLSRALEHAWHANDHLTDEQKKLIVACLPQEVIEQGGEAPQREEQLEELQQILSACDTILRIEKQLVEDGGEARWLTENGQKFPTAIRKYIHHAACYFLNHNEHLNKKFADSLRSHIETRGAHIATLNYDDLLYEAFVDTPVFRKHLLRDGFLRGDFAFDWAEKKYNAKDEGWFLHLHGSPLFVDKNNNPKKVTRANLRGKHGSSSIHLVLTSVKFKRAIIQNSTILKSYWEKMRTIIPTSSNIILLGYGGEDIHLNELLRLMAPNGSIRVVEYKGENDQAKRETYWQENLGELNVEVTLLDNIQDFRDWHR